MEREIGVSIQGLFDTTIKNHLPEIPTKGDAIDLESTIGFDTQEHYALRNTVQFAIFHPDAKIRRCNAQILELLGVKDAFRRGEEIYIRIRSEDNDGILAYLCKAYPEYQRARSYSFEAFFSSTSPSLEFSARE